MAKIVSTIKKVAISGSLLFLTNAAFAQVSQEGKLITEWDELKELFKKSTTQSARYDFERELSSNRPSKIHLFSAISGKDGCRLPIIDNRLFPFVIDFRPFVKKMEKNVYSIVFLPR